MNHARSIAAALILLATAAGGIWLAFGPQPEPEPEATSEPEAPADTSAEELGGHPHPITQEHETIQHQLQLVAALNDAFDRHDISSLRRLIERYREADPQDEHALRAGYERLADCLQYPGEASRASAQAYYDTERASTLRRYIRRACLE